MANVPNTDSFSLNDVYLSVSSHASPSTDLVDCFAKSVDAYFDATYKDSKNALYNFRNYTVSFGTTTTTTLYGTQITINGSSICNTIDDAGVTFWYYFYVNTGGIHTIQTTGPTDTYMVIHKNSTSGPVVAQDDDAGVDNNAYVSTYLTGSTLYYIDIHGYNYTSTGDFCVNVVSAAATTTTTTAGTTTTTTTAGTTTTTTTTNCANAAPILSIGYSNSTSIGIGINIQSNSIVLAHFGLKANETITAPSGWNTISSITGSGTIYTASYYKAYSSATAETATFNFSGSANKICNYYHIQNCSVASSISQYISTSTQTSYTTPSDLTQYSCKTYLSSLLVNVATTPVISVGTNWTSLGNGTLNVWGCAAQKHYQTGSIPTTSYSSFNAGYVAHNMFILYIVPTTTTTTTPAPTTTTTTPAPTTTTTTTAAGSYTISWSTNMTMGGIFQVFVNGTPVISQGSAGSGSLGPYAAGSSVYVVQNSGGCQYGADSSLTGASSGGCNGYGCDAITGTILLSSNVSAAGQQHC